MPKTINPLRLDPTRTTMERRALIADMARRCASLRRAIYALVVTEDAFGLEADAQAAARGAGQSALAGTVRTIPLDMVINTRWRFDTDDKKVEAYQEWFKGEVKAGLLEVDPANQNTPWLAKNIKSAYKKGALRAYTDTHKTAADKSMDFVEGGKAQFMKDAFDGPIAEGKMRGLYTRSFSQLQGVTAQMDADMSRTLTQGLAQGKGTKAIARDLQKNVTDLEKRRCRAIARTEIVHAHNEGQLDSFEAMNMEGVGVMAEWSTAHDGQVCPLCAPMEGVVLTVKEARGMLPRHPNCRCAWIPANVGEEDGGTTQTTWAGPEQGLEAPGTLPTGKTTGQVWSKDEQKARLLASIKAEHPKLDAKAARAASRWVGADASITGKLKPGSKAAQAAQAAAQAAKATVQAAAAAQATQAAQKTKAVAAKRAAGKAQAAQIKVVEGVQETTQATQVGKKLDFTGAEEWKTKDFHDFRVDAQKDIDPVLEKALHDYMFEPEKGKRGYAEVNADLRAGKNLTDDPIAGPLLKYFNETPTDTTYTLANDTMLYRGVGFNNDDPFLLKMLTPGSEITDAAFMSTTTHQDFGRVLARRLAKDKDVKIVLNVRVPGGTRIIMTNNDSAQEVLLGPNTRIRIKAVTDHIDKNDDLYKYVSAEIISADDVALDAAKAKLAQEATQAATKTDAAAQAVVDDVVAVVKPTKGPPGEPIPKQTPKAPIPKEVEEVLGIENEITSIVYQTTHASDQRIDMARSYELREIADKLRVEREAAYARLWKARRDGTVPPAATVLPEALDEITAARAALVGDLDDWVKTAYGTDTKEVSRKLQKAVDEADVMMGIKATDLKKVLADGEFKNSLQTGKGTFTTIGDTRAIEERTFLGVTAATDDVELYPKYGFLTKPGMQSDPMLNFGYGGTFVKFKRQNITGRTTVTFGDSYNNNVMGRIATPARLEEVDHRVLSRYASSAYGEQPKSKAVQNVVQAADIDDYGLGEYVEAQIYGKLGVEDIEAVYTASKKEKKVLEGALKKAGLKDVPVLALEKDPRLKMLVSGDYSKEALRLRYSLTPDDIDRLGDAYIETFDLPSTLWTWQNRNNFKLPDDIAELVDRYDPTNKNAFTIAERRELLKRFYRRVPEQGNSGLPKPLYEDYRPALANWTEDVISEKALKGFT